MPMQMLEKLTNERYETCSNSDQSKNMKSRCISSIISDIKPPARRHPTD